MWESPSALSYQRREFAANTNVTTKQANFYGNMEISGDITVTVMYPVVLNSPQTTYLTFDRWTLAWINVASLSSPARSLPEESFSKTARLYKSSEPRQKVVVAKRILHPYWFNSEQRSEQRQKVVVANIILHPKWFSTSIGNAWEIV